MIIVMKGARSRARFAVTLAATDGGLSRLKDGRIATLTRKNALPCDAIHATIEDDDHSVWLLLACGVMRVARDGLRDRALVPTTKPAAAKPADGKLWFATEGGVHVVDPRHLPFNKLRPPHARTPRAAGHPRTRRTGGEKAVGLEPAWFRNGDRAEHSGAVVYAKTPAAKTAGVTQSG